MKKAFFPIVLAAGMLCACQGNQTKTATDAQANDPNPKDSTEMVAQDIEKDKTYISAVDRYLVNEIGKKYAKGEYCVPFYTIMDVDESNAEDILVLGDFWVFNYDLVGDTLKCVSGGSHPGRMHIQEVENSFNVTACDQVEDGSGFTTSAKRIFGEKYEAFQTVNSDEVAREKLRAEILDDYVKKQGLSATMYQDYGWPAKKLP